MVVETVLCWSHLETNGYMQGGTLAWTLEQTQDLSGNTLEI